jgi:ribonuclease Z
MKVVFLGVGEAGDENYANNSHIIISKTILLLDCGYSVPQSLWKYNPNPEFLDAIYVSHFHADHYFGVPVVLCRMNDQGRKKPITLIVPRGGIEQMRALMRYGYPSLDSPKFDIHILESKDEISLGELKLTFALTNHTQPDHAVRITDGSVSVCYSGDGAPIAETERLYKDCNLLIQEGLFYEQEKKGHAIISQAVAAADRCGAKRVAITHIELNERKRADEIRKKLPEFAFIPEPGDALDL